MQQAIQRLGLDVIRDAISDRTQSPLGAAMAAALRPLPALDDARERVGQIQELRGLLEREEVPPVAGATDVEAALEQGEKGIVIEGEQLRDIASTMLTATALRRFSLAREDEAPLLFALGAAIADLSRVAGEVGRSFEPSGRLADTASEDLGPLRKRLRTIEDRMTERLEIMLKSPRLAPLLQEDYFTVRGDRYVLPIKASFKNEVKGIVHDASGTGQTVFIEPQEVVDAGNSLKIARSEVLEEERRILARLTRLVVGEAQNVRTAVVILGHVDLLTACARLGEDLDCAPIEVGDAPGFDLISARHPQLVLQKLADPASPMVANDIGLGDDHQVLVLTGPNTGGKTVAMKTVGMLVLMARCGLHVPCDAKSKIGWYEALEVVIGDEQSIAGKLSTFAAHIRQLTDVLHRADQRTLVLVDEIAADTDPTQGQAMAQALLEAFAEREAHTIVTTHFEGLKAIPFADPRFRNAGVGFDPDNFVPTYRVTLDVPQGSNGFDIAQSLGLPEDIVGRARALTSEGTRAIDDLMKSLQSKALELDKARAEAERAEEELQAAKQQAEKAREALERTRKEVIDGERLELLEEIHATRNTIRGIVASLQKAGADPRDAMRQANAAAKELADLEASELDKTDGDVPERGLERLEEVNLGDWVHVPRLGRDGTVVKIESREVLVAVGNVRTRVPKASLRGAKTKAKRNPNAQRFKKPAAPARPEAVVVITSGEEIDVRGLDTDECLARLDGFLDHHFGRGTTHVRIIHGHGTGALKAAIRSHLNRSGYVRKHRPGDEKEGGDGATVAQLA